MKRKKNLPDRELRNLVRGAISDLNRLHKGIGRVRQHITLGQIPGFIEWIRQFPESSRALGAGTIWENYSSLHAQSVPSPIGLLEEVQWCASILTPQVDELSKFCGLKANFSAKLIAGKDGGVELDEIRERYGASLWILEAKIAALQWQGGIEAQKNFSREVQSQAPKLFAGFVSYYLSERYEQSVSAVGFRNRITNASMNWKVKGDYLTYIRYRLLRDIPRSRSDLADVLRYELRSSLIDLYHTLLDVVHAYVFLVPEGSSDAGRIFEILKPLLDIKDPILRKLMFCLRPEGVENKLLSFRRLAAADAFSAGKYRIARKYGVRQIRVAPLDLSSVIDYSKACAAQEAPPREKELGSSINLYLAERLYKLFLKTDDADEAIADLEKAALNLACISIGKGLREPIDYRISRDALNRGLHVRSALLASPYFDPKQILLGPVATPQQRILSALKTSNSRTVQVSEEILVGKGDIGLLGEGVSAEYRDQTRLRRSAHFREWGAAKDAALSLCSSSIRSFKSDGVLFRIRCYLLSGELLDALNLLAIEAINRFSFAYFLPLDELLDGKEWRDFRQYAERIEVPIAFDLYWRFRHKNEYQRARRIAWRQFLRSNGLRRPSEIGNIQERFDRQLLIYFLEYVCVQEVMDISTAFSTSAEVDDERSAVCVLLSKINPERRTLFDAEVVEITKRKRIESGLRDIDSSRLYVDTDSLTAWVAREHSEAYKRFLEHKRAGVNASDEDLLKVVYDLIKKAGASAGELPVPSVEPAEKILFDLASVICAGFLLHPMFGLDRFLSMRVRHTSFAGRLRGPLQEHHLLTPFDEQTQMYGPNNYWLDKLLPLTAESKVQLLEAFSSFCKKLDQAIDEFVSKKLQVRTSDTSAGVFNIAVPNIWVASIRKIISTDFTLEDFTQFCFKTLCFSQIETCLTLLRDELHRDLGQKLRQLLDELETETVRLLPAAKAAVISQEVGRAKVELQQSLANVETWFYFSQSQQASIETYNVENAIDIAYQATRITRHGFDPELAVRVDDGANIFTSPYSFAWVTDALFIVFDNIFLHSKVPSGRPTVNVHAFIPNEHVLRIRVTSEVGPEAKIRRVEDNLEKIRRDIATGDYVRYTRKEGGSGLIKLRAICLSSAESPDPVKFGFTDDGRFFVEVESSLELMRALKPKS